MALTIGQRRRPVHNFAAGAETELSTTDRYDDARGTFDELITWSRGAHERSHSEVEREFSVRGQELLRHAFQGHLAERYDIERHSLRAVGKRRGLRVRVRTRDLESIFGRVQVRRHALLRRGKAADIPMDRVLNLPRELYSHTVRRRVADEARRGSWDQAIDTIDRTTGAHVPKRQAEALVQRAAVDFEDFYAEKLHVANGNALSTEALLVLSSDSKGVPMLPEALRDATRKQAEEAERTTVRGDPMAQKKLRRHDRRMAIVTAVFEQEPHKRTADDIVAGLDKTDRSRRAKAPRPHNKRVSASVEKSQAAGISEMFDEADRRDPKRMRTTVVLVDGEERQIDEVRKQAKMRGRNITLVVDLLHVLHYLFAAGLALCRKNEAATAVWVAHYLCRLLTAKTPFGVIQGIRSAATKRGLSAEERVPVDRCADYLLGVAHYIRYAEFLRQGFPIATGIIEGACRHLVQDRLGITGARWGLRSAEAVLKLRALHSSGDLDEYWRFHELREAQRRHHVAA